MGKNLTPAELKKFANPDDWWAELAVIPLAAQFVARIQNTTISPNQVTLLSCILAVTACLCIMWGNHAVLIIAALLLHASYVCDLADGMLARYKKEFSPFGGWLDGLSDRIIEFLIIFSLAYRLQPFTVKTVFLALYSLFLLAMYHGFISINLPVVKNREKTGRKIGTLSLLNKLRHKFKFGFFVWESSFLCIWYFWYWIKSNCFLSYFQYTAPSLSSVFQFLNTASIPKTTVHEN